MQKIKNFSSDDWNLKTCEVRTDSGKFVNSSWEFTFDDEKYWITIGFGETVQTVVKKKSSGKSNIVTCGEFYNFVEQVNRGLMLQEVNTANKP